MSDQPCPSCGGTTGFTNRRGTIDVCEDPWHGDVSQHQSAGAGASAEDVAFWDAVNRYVVACGGDPSKRTVSSPRMTAVADIERLRRRAQS